MPLFACTTCNNIENTALCNYWIAKEGKQQCSNCDPAILEWHGEFEQNSAVGYNIDSRGFIHKPNQNLNPNVEIVGQVREMESDRTASS